MQPQSEIFNKSKFKTKIQESLQQTSATTANKSTTTTTTTTALQRTQQHKQRHRCKINKSKKPLTHFKFYLDICNHQTGKKIEELIQSLGGNLEFFLTSNVTHFITDKTVTFGATVGGELDKQNIYNRPVTPNSTNYNHCTSISTPGTPLTPKTPYSQEATTAAAAAATTINDGGCGVASGRNTPNATTPIGSRITRQSRADAILNLVKRQGNNNTATTSSAPASVVRSPKLHVRPRTPISISRIDKETSIQLEPNPPYAVWSTEEAFLFFKKIQNDLSHYLDVSKERKLQNSGKGKGLIEPISLKGGFLKIEALKQSHRPYFQIFRKPTSVWPKIDISRDDGAFRLSPKKGTSVDTFIKKAAAAVAITASAAEADIEKQKNMTRKSRSRSSQRPLPAAVQALKKTVADSTNDRSGNKTSGQQQQQRNSNSLASRQQQQQQQQVKESSDRQCGVCEICKIEYDTLTIHLKTKDHEYFAKNSQNFIALDTLIQSSADVNKFLAEDVEQKTEDDGNSEEIKNELEEMEVDEDALTTINGTAASAAAADALEEEIQPRDPLGQSPLTVVTTQEEKCRSSLDRSFKVTLSPTLREKSKRTTKGKHSSEKFQNSPNALSKTTPPAKSAKSPKTQPKSVSPPKRPSIVEQRIDSIPTKPEATPSLIPTTTIFSNRKKCTTTATTIISPPIRAMLPPSSMYKVVETQEYCTPTRKLRDGTGDGHETVGSPSLIVKFKKVRSTELMRLNGEAENFMFPKQRTSSDVPTDCDRQTTSENLRLNSINRTPESTSEFIDAANTENITTTPNVSPSKRGSLQRSNTMAATTTTNVCVTKAIAIAKRRTKPSSVKTLPNQSFQTAPIQPEVQQLNQKCETQQKTVTLTTTTNESAKKVAPKSVKSATTTTTATTTAGIYPEATRKSSRTATAIVTAATTSSRLLRAAVEAAKNNVRRSGTSNEATASVNHCISEPLLESTLTDASPFRVCTPRKSITNETVIPLKRCRLTRHTTSVVKLEDGMGENYINNDDEQDTDQTDNDTDEEIDNDDDEDVYDDDTDDEDYVATQKCYNRKVQQKELTTTKADLSKSSREERAAKRQSRRITEIFETSVWSDGNSLNAKPAPVAKKAIPGKLKTNKSEKSKTLTSPGNSSATSTKKKASPLQRLFDPAKSERIQKMRYAFERLPTSDLWFRVFSRQDACEENYYEYYGSTNYRKLPYELGPIPLNLTLGSSCCKLCENKNKKDAKITLEPANVIPTTKSCEITNKIQVKSEPKVENESTINATETINATTTVIDSNQNENRCSSPPNVSLASTSQYTLKHKKLHLLQRYRQEQQELEAKQKLEKQEPLTLEQNKKLLLENEQKKEDERFYDVVASPQPAKCYSKASTPDFERIPIRSRAGSTHSTASSCTSSSTTLNPKRYRNKHLSKASFLSLELPPRKSPREHASTLALVSCIIKQRQDSLSKTNSETDEPPTTPTPTRVPTTPVPKEEELPINAELNKIPIEIKKEIKETSLPIPTPPPLPIVPSSPRTMRSAAATPIEELCFATEISENVKRQRRGQNKYDHSPPFVLNAGRRPARGRVPKSPTIYCGRRIPLPPSLRKNQTPVPIKRRKRQKKHPSAYGKNKFHYNFGGNNGVGAGGGGLLTTAGILPSIRKTGCKKGVLEFEMDTSALKAVSTVTPEPNNRILEWQIDKYLELAGKDYDMHDVDWTTIVDDSVPNDIAAVSSTSAAAAAANATAPSSETNESINHDMQRLKDKKSTTPTIEAVNTPPPTDYFSSDFDLYDLVTNINATNGDDDPLEGKRKGVSLYNTVALHNYFRRRKNPKSNRTGWPKAQKKKTSARQQQKIRFLQGLGDANMMQIKQEVIDEEEEDNDLNEQTRESGVITPPESDNHDNHDEIKTADNNEDADLDAAENIPEEDDAETTADSIQEDETPNVDATDVNINADHDADADADCEEDYVDDEDDDEEYEIDIKPESTAIKLNGSAAPVVEDENACEAGDFESARKRDNSTGNRCPASPTEKLGNCLTPDMAVVTSTPTVHMLRGLRRTPQLNGSLGSCISPSEKAGDISDIFTVSSDGLDTDLDISNPTNKNHHHNHHSHHHHNNHQHNTPRKKYDITRYAPPNRASSSCAAEAATAAVKSMAISQFLKKEVRVTCRRLKAPFRRFRYRR